MQKSPRKIIKKMYYETKIKIGTNNDSREQNI